MLGEENLVMVREVEVVMDVCGAGRPDVRLTRVMLPPQTSTGEGTRTSSYQYFWCLPK